jgi:phosphoribosylaminoimidazole-succinocarboxamide synthase
VSRVNFLKQLFFCARGLLSSHRVDFPFRSSKIRLYSRDQIFKTKGPLLILSSIILQTQIDGVPLHARGKVRDVYSLGESLLFVATDRISAFDYILASGIPDKGRVLTQLSLFWFDFLKDVVPNHLITADFAKYPRELQMHEDQLAGRSMIVKRAEMFPVECVVRGYLSGSGWKEYQQLGSVCGIKLPAGLKESDRLPEPLFTPAAKATSGHDENISFDEVASRIGTAAAEKLRDLSLQLYAKAATHALKCGIILADTKFEFGVVDGNIVLADEVFTPDSSRFWPAETYKPGGPQLSFDKQFVRDYLESIHWNKQPPAPALPDEVAQKTSEKYKQAFRQLTGKELRD